MATCSLFRGKDRKIFPNRSIELMDARIDSALKTFDARARVSWGCRGASDVGRRLITIAMDERP
jgi:hypothetical protein